MADTGVHLLRAQQACCADTAGVDAHIGVAVQHPDARDGSQCERHVYWRDTPDGRPTVTLASFDPLTIAGTIDCPCGWTGTVTEGVVT